MMPKAFAAQSYAAYIVGAGGLAPGVSRAARAAPAIVDIAAAHVLSGFSLIWAGARVFDGPVNPLALLPVPLFWLIASRIPAVAGCPDERAAIVATMLAGLTASEIGEGATSRCCRAGRRSWR